MASPSIWAVRTVRQAEEIPFEHKQTISFLYTFMFGPFHTIYDLRCRTVRPFAQKIESASPCPPPPD